MAFERLKEFYDSAIEKVSNYFGVYQPVYAGIGSNTRDFHPEDSALDNVMFFGDQMKKRVLVDIIREHGGRLIRSSAHEIYEVNGRTAPVPHGSGGKEIPGGTVKSILRILGINL